MSAAAEAKKIFDENEKDAEDGFTPVTTRLTSLFDRPEMERASGRLAWMEEEERRISRTPRRSSRRAASGPRSGASAQRPR